MHRLALAEVFAYPGWANATEFRAKDLEFREKFPPLPLIGIGQVNVFICNMGIYLENKYLWAQVWELIKHCCLVHQMLIFFWRMVITL